MNSSLLRRAADADVCLLLEGTFPYVRGGVSSWVDGMIRAFPDIRFAIAFIGSRREDYGDPAFALPENVVHFTEQFLYEQKPADHETAHEIPGDADAFAHSARLHAAWRSADAADGTALMTEVAKLIGDDGPLNEKAFLSSRAAWNYIVDQYRENCTDPSFTDYFWTVRIMHQPLWQLERMTRTLPPARIYHTISTGYAGFLGTLLHYRTGRPLIVSEHGIYTKERKIDLLQSDWISDNRGAFEKDVSKISYFRELWVRFFEALGRMSYDAADEIVALYEANRKRQIADGANAAITQNIPNGVDVQSLSTLVERRSTGKRRVVALVGRVVPIKDVKTFIRGIFIASRTMPDIVAWIVGPEEEDRDYAEECRALAQSLGLADRIEFHGFKRMDEMLPSIDLIALTSISEALPLVVLEGFAAGVPAVTTDVGACRQLIEGDGAEDAALGSAGAIVPIANPAAFAQAVLDMLGNEAQWERAQQAAIARVHRFYTKEKMIERYRALYEKLRTLPERERRGLDKAKGCPMHAGGAAHAPSSTSSTPGAR
jgi:glycosyltransferase involved in cell wall biosynthesis